MDAMPGFYEHEETMQHMEAEGESEDDHLEQLGMVTATEKPKKKPRPPVSAPARSSTPPAKLEGFPPKTVSSKPKPLGRERSKSDVGQRSAHLRPESPGEKQTQVCPICSRTLVTDNQGLNAHIDFCLSRDAIQEARGENGGVSINTPKKVVHTEPSSVPVSNGWDFLMVQKGTHRAKGSKKRM